MSAEVCPPNEAEWYVEVIYGRNFCKLHKRCNRDKCNHRTGTETDYTYEFYKGDKPTLADCDALVPEGWVRRESRIRPCK